MLFLNGWTEAARGNFISRIKSDVSWLCFWRSMVEFFCIINEVKIEKKVWEIIWKIFGVTWFFFRFNIDDEKTIREKVGKFLVRQRV